MKKLLAGLVTLVLLFSVCGAVFAEGGETNAEPAFERPVSISVTDETGAPVSDAALRLSDSDGNVLKTWNAGGEQSFFLKEGIYTVENLSVSDDYLEEAAPVEVTVARTEEEQALYTGAVEYDHDHTEICSNPNHVGLELYTVSDGYSDPIIAYCFNQGLSNPTEDSRYTMLVATPDLLYSYALNKSDTITARELYDHVLDVIYRSAKIKEKFSLPDDVIVRYLTHMAIKNFTDPKCFTGYDGTVLGTIMGHAINENRNNPDYVYPENYKNAFNYLIGDCTLDASDYHPENFYLYLYYPNNFDRNDDNSYQILMSAKQTEPQNVMLAVRPAVRFEITLVWNNSKILSRQYLPTSSEVASKLQLFADGVDVTDLYRSNLEVVDNHNSTYSIRFVKLPKLTENTEEIHYSLKLSGIKGYMADKREVTNGETIVFSPVMLARINPLPALPVKPIKP